MKKILFYFALLALLSCQKEEQYKQVTYEYKYEVTGTSGSYNVTIDNIDGNTQQFSNVGNSWYYKYNKTLYVKNDGEPIEEHKKWYYISAQNRLNSGNVTVNIYRGGKIVATNTSYGGYTIATASGNF